MKLFHASEDFGDETSAAVKGRKVQTSERPHLSRFRQGQGKREKIILTRKRPFYLS